LIAKDARSRLAKPSSERYVRTTGTPINLTGTTQPDEKD
jgi:hypothetical protein